MANFLFFARKNFKTILQLALAADQNEHKTSVFLNDPKTKIMEEVEPLITQLIKRQIPVYFYSHKAQLPEAFNQMIPRRLDEVGEMLEAADHLIAL